MDAFLAGLMSTLGVATGVGLLLGIFWLVVLAVFWNEP